MKKAYSELAQALNMARVEYGDMSSWKRTLLSLGDQESMSRYFIETYIFPNTKFVKKCVPSSFECWNGISAGYTTAPAHVAALAPSGYSVLSWIDRTAAGGWFYVDIDGPAHGPGEEGKDIFALKFVFQNGVDTVNSPIKAGLYFSGLQYVQTPTREELIDGNYCGALVYLDGWQIKDDNPCWQ